MLWENSSNDELLKLARRNFEILERSCHPIDPFSGGGLSLWKRIAWLPAYGSDLNPVAVMIGGDD